LGSDHEPGVGDPCPGEGRLPVHATDDFGFTPLMYAATVDVGNVEALKALLAVGADRCIRNDAGRTPLEQARHYKHADLTDALK
jgi:ankyrin repeat protein